MSALKRSGHPGSELRWQVMPVSKPSRTPPGPTRPCWADSLTYRSVDPSDAWQRLLSTVPQIPSLTFSSRWLSWHAPAPRAPTSLEAWRPHWEAGALVAGSGHVREVGVGAFRGGVGVSGSNVSVTSGHHLADGLAG